MKTNRKEFIKVFGGIVAGIFIFSKAGVLGAMAADRKTAKKSAQKKPELALPAGQVEVSATDAVASAIGYVPEASQVDRKKYAQYKTGQQCSKCALYSPLNDSWGKCQMINSGAVKSGGWCGSFNAKT